MAEANAATDVNSRIQALTKLLHTIHSSIPATHTPKDTGFTAVDIFTHTATLLTPGNTDKGQANRVVAVTGVLRFDKQKVAGDAVDTQVNISVYVFLFCVMDPSKLIAVWIDLFSIRMHAEIGARPLNLPKRKGHKTQKSCSSQYCPLLPRHGRSCRSPRCER
jgi:hypothetical protein